MPLQLPTLKLRQMAVSPINKATVTEILPVFTAPCANCPRSCPLSCPCVNCPLCQLSTVGAVRCAHHFLLSGSTTAGNSDSCREGRCHLDAAASNSCAPNSCPLEFLSPGPLVFVSSHHFFLADAVISGAATTPPSNNGSCLGGQCRLATAAM